MTKADLTALIDEIKSDLKTYNTSYGFKQLFLELKRIGLVPPSWEEAEEIYNQSYATVEEWNTARAGDEETAPFTTGGQIMEWWADIIGDVLDTKLTPILDHIQEKFSVSVSSIPTSFILDTLPINTYTSVEWSIVIIGSSGRKIQKILAGNVGTGVSVSSSTIGNTSIGTPPTDISIDVTNDGTDMKLLLTATSTVDSVSIMRSTF